MFNSLIAFLGQSANSIFWASGIFGTTLFVLRMLMTVLGGVFDGDDIDMSADVDFDDVHHHHDASTLYKLFSLHSLSGFFMLFGWVGLACSTQYDLPLMVCVAYGFCAGFAMMVITAMLFKGASLLHSQGAVFDIHDAVGHIGTVYQQIPSHGYGKIHVVVHGVTRELLAQSADKQAIPSFAKIKITHVIDNVTVAVIELI